ncbi:MAG: site-specific integrase [Treponema sp.]|nr:site-specific integrase [Treponema sp.]
MQDVTRNSYSLYKRDSGSRTIWYVRFWDDETQSYTSGRSTGQTTKAAAQRQAQKWLAEGLPEAQKKDPKATKNRLMGAIAKYLEDCELTKKGETRNAGEIIKLFYTQVTNMQMSSGERFVDYLYRFWDWNGDYVQGRLERGKTIGKKYVDDHRSKISSLIEPYFKNTLLSDITANNLEQFMKSIPRRDVDPENGYARRTINIVMKLIKKAMKEAVRLEIIPRNPAEKIELLADDPRERGILTPAELKRLFQLDWPDERSKTAAILASVSGMRISEIIGLRIDELDLERQVIHVRHSFSAYEKRLKGTKNEKSRFIYTDVSILNLLSELYQKNPWHNSFIFWGTNPDKPMRYETIEAHLEKTLAVLMGEHLKITINDEWRELVSALSTKIELAPHEMAAIGSGNLDTTQDVLRIRYCYSCPSKKAAIVNYSEEKLIPLQAPQLKQLSAFCGKSSNVLIVRGNDRENPLDFENLAPDEEKRMMLVMGEIIRMERNLTFHGFRHFFNSTIRGTVSDDILRLQTGHIDEKMTDHYDHMTDDRGEQLRKAVQTKILPFIPKAAGE